MDKFMIDPPDNITIDQLRVEQVDPEIPPEMGPPISPSTMSSSMSSIAPSEQLVIKDSFIPSSITPTEQLVIKDSFIPSSTIETKGPVGKFITESLTPTMDPLPTAPEVNPDVKKAFVESVEVVPEPTYSLRTWLIWVLTLFVFIAFSIYYIGKYAINESNYVIKKNAGKFKVSFADIKADIESWNENLYDKINQFFFRQHVDNGVFKMTKYRIPKMLVPTGPEEKSAKQKPAK